MTADRQNTPQDAPHARLSDFQAPQAPGDAATAPDATGRARRYAEAIWGKASTRAVVAAVMAVADQEQAELRGEVERLRAEVIRAEAAEAERDALRAEVDDARRSARTAWDVHREHVDMMNPRLLHWQSVADDEKRRLEAAEAESARLASVVAKVEALVDSWPAYRTDDRSDYGRAVAQCRNALRAALASLVPDTATPGKATLNAPRPAGGFIGTYPRRWNLAPDECLLRLVGRSARCVRGDHNHSAAASSADDNLGGES